MRALVVCVAYVVLSGAGAVLLSQLYRPGFAAVFAVALAAILTVPLAVLAPVPTGEPSPPDDPRPVLQRGARSARPQRRGSPSR